jgi:DNA polymerase III sliding clamp (beta) subunit (PCNA family)
MRFTAPAESLRAAVDTAASFAPNDGLRPQLECVKVTVREDGTAEFAATDLYRTCWFAVAGATDTDPGSVSISSKNLLRSIKQAKTRGITLSHQPGQQKATIKFGSTEVGLVAEESFPDIARFNRDLPSASIDGEVLKGLVKRTRFATHKDFKFRVLSGVQFLITGGGHLQLAASDGVRLAVAKAPVAGPLTGAAICPPFDHKLLNRIYTEEKPAIEFQYSESALRLVGAAGELSFRTIAGEYPDVSIAAGIDLSTRVDLACGEFKELLQRATLLKVQTQTDYRFNLVPGRLDLEVKAGVEGDVTASLAVEWPGAQTRIGLDPALMLPAVKVMDAERIVLCLGNPTDPACLREMNGQIDYAYFVGSRV